MTKCLSWEEEGRLLSEFVNQGGNTGLIGGYCEEGYPFYYANGEMAAMMGYASVEELARGIGGKVSNAIHPEDAEQVEKDIGTDYREGMTFETTCRMARKDGSWFWVVNKGKVIRAGDGRLATISACTDMSNFVRRQKELEEKSRVSDYLFKSLPGGYHRCAMDEGYSFLYVSQRFLDLLGWTEEELQTRFDNKFMNLLHPEDRSLVPEYVSRILSQATEAPYQDMTYRLQCKDGYHWFSDTTMEVDVVGKRFFQGFITDINSFAEELRKRYEIISALGSLYSEIALVDLTQERYTVVTGPFEGKTGSLEELEQIFIGKNISEDYREEAAAFIRFADAADRLQNRDSISHIFRGRSGNWYSLSCIVKKRNAEGRVTHILMTARNVNEEKNRELEEQRVSELRMKTMTEAIHGGFRLCKYDERCTIVMVSEQLAKMLGYDSAQELMEASGGNMLGLANPEDITREMGQAMGAIDAGEMYTMRYRVRCKDGSWRSVEDRGRRLWNAAREPELWSFMVDQDELARKTVALDKANSDNQALEKKQTWTDSYNRNLLDMVKCGVVAYSLSDHKLIHVNKEALRIFGADSMEKAQRVMNPVLRNVVYRDPIVPRRLHSLTQADGAIDYECIIPNQRGLVTDVLARTESYSSLSGQRCAVTTFLDVSENVELKNEKSILDALCADYVSVHLCDLEQDTVMPVSAAAAAEERALEKTAGPEIHSFDFRVKYAYEHIIVQESAPDFMSRLNAEYLRAYLRDHRRSVFRVRAKPNPTGYEYFEIQVVRTAGEDGCKALIGFRHVDDVIREEERQRALLENALAASNRKNEIIEAISKIYWQAFSVDLRKGTYKEVFANGKFTIDDPTYAGVARNAFLNSLHRFADPSYRQELETFLDHNTLPERLAKTETISMEYKSSFGAWLSGRYIVQSRDQEGRADKVLFLIQQIDAQKRKELDYQERLAKAAEEARSANRAKTEFLRRMSHDIRTPLNGIIGMLKIQERHTTNPQTVAECTQKAMAASAQLLMLVNDVLDISKLEADKIVVDHQPFDLISALLGQVSAMEAFATQYHVRVYGGRKESVIRHRYLIGSANYLNRVLSNIGSNAIKYNRPEGAVYFKCTELSADDKTAVYQLVCEDTGIGMSAEFQKHAFEPYAQEGKLTTTSVSGTGLGLAIAKKLVDQMGGTIHLESRENVGTRFTITIPFEIDRATMERLSETAPKQKEDFSGQRALLVEDNEMNREIATVLLEELGLRVDCAENGKEALDRFTASAVGEYDYIFMDVMMPVMDGLEATRAIRALDRPDAKTVPILAASANAFRDDICRSLESGMNAHLTKPLDLEKIRMEMQKIALTKKRGEEA